MGSEQIALPMQATQEKGLKFILPFYWLALIFVFASVGLQEASQNNDGSIRQIYIWLPTLFIAITAILIFSVRIKKPSTLNISRTSITITPIRIMGYSWGTAQSYSVSDFSSVSVMLVYRKGGSIYKIVLQGKKEGNEIVFDHPDDADPKEFARQLALALNLKANINA